MKVKIGNTVYDANKEPIMIMLDEQEREMIENSVKEHGGSPSHLCMAPKNITEEELEKFLGEEGKCLKPSRSQKFLTMVELNENASKVDGWQKVGRCRYVKG